MQYIAQFTKFFLSKAPDTPNPAMGGSLWGDSPQDMSFSPGCIENKWEICRPREHQTSLESFGTPKFPPKFLSRKHSFRITH